MKLQDAIELTSKAVRLIEPMTKGHFEDDGFKMATGDDPLINDIYKEVSEKLKDIVWLVEYANKPVKVDGTLYKNEQGRYEFDNGAAYLTGGSKVELYVPKEEQYVLTTIEHREDYYAVRCPEVELEGARARMR